MVQSKDRTQVEMNRHALGSDDAWASCQGGTGRVRECRQKMRLHSSGGGAPTGMAGKLAFRQRVGDRATNCAVGVGVRLCTV